MQIQFAQNNSGSGQVTTSSFADYLTVPINVVGASATIEISAVCGFIKTGTGNCNINIVWDGVQIAETVVSVQGGYGQCITARAIVTGVAPGAHTAKVQIKHNAGSATVGGAASSASLTVMEW